VALALARLEATRRRKAIEENVALHGDLQARDKMIRRLVDSNIVGIIIWEVEGRILEANDAFLRMVGYDREDLTAGRLHRTTLTPPEWRDRDARTVAELKRIGTAQPFEKEYVRKDGSRVPVLIGGAMFEEGTSQGVGFVLDLTERRRAVEALRQSEERFRTLVQFSFDVYWETDAQHRFIHQEFAESLADAPASGSEIGKTRWDVPYLEPDEEGWRKLRESPYMTYGGRTLGLHGTPEHVVDRLQDLTDAGLDGVIFILPDFAEDLPYFEHNVLPLLEQSGLRNPHAPA